MTWGEREGAQVIVGQFYRINTTDGRQKFRFSCRRSPCFGYGLGTDVGPGGVVAMARTNAPNSVGSQFFIVLDDAARGVLESFNTYQIIGTVTAGMEVADAIHAASGGAENPASPVSMTRVTVTTP